MISNALSSKLSNILSYMFYYNRTVLPTCLSLSKFSGRFLTGKVKGKTAVVPLFRNLVDITTVEQLKNFKEGLFIDRDYENHTVNILTALSWWKDVPHGTLRTFKIKQQRYYVGRGIIMDGDFNVLFLATIEVSDKSKRQSGGPIRYLLLGKPEIHINPVLFTDKKHECWRKLFVDGAALFNRNIPHYYCNQLRGFEDKSTMHQLKIVIEDPSKFVYAVAHPGVESLNESLNPETLLQNLPLINKVRI